MKILLAGGEVEATALLQALAHSSDHEIAHCADSARAIAELLRKRYDWVILDGPSLLEDKTDITRIIRMMSPEACRNRVTPVQANTYDARSTNHTKCGVEWSKSGVLQLHCGLHALLKDTPAPWQPNLGCAGEFIFEYHAPCSKGRRRDG